MSLLSRPQTQELPASASQAAGIKGLGHHCRLSLSFSFFFVFCVYFILPQEKKKGTRKREKRRGEEGRGKRKEMKKKRKSCLWWCMLVNPALESPRKGNCEFEADSGCTNDTLLGKQQTTASNWLSM